MSRPAATIALALLGALPLASCMQREIVITSDPPGAVVTVNDVEVGRTPTSLGFEYYGVFDVQARAAGYETASGPQKVAAPFYEFAPIDLVASAMPFGVMTTRKVHLTLVPEAKPATDAERRAEEAELVGRARALRDQLGPGR